MDQRDWFTVTSRKEGTTCLLLLYDCFFLFRGGVKKNPLQYSFFKMGLQLEISRIG